LCCVTVSVIYDIGNPDAVEWVSDLLKTPVDARRERARLAAVMGGG
jgi:hypothetical protein